MNGRLIAIEGLDGSGKQTQTQRLYERLTACGQKVKKVEFPNYGSQSSSLVKMYLRGDFGTNAGEISPYISSTFFAADRYATYKTELEKVYLGGGIILADRYTTSNMMHQGSKITDETQLNQFLDWLWNLEFSIYKIPVPSKVYFLNIPPLVSQQLMKERQNKFTHAAAKDIHESDFLHLQSSYDAAQFLIKKYGWDVIECFQNDRLMSVEQINDTLFSSVMQFLNGEARS